MAFGEPLEDQKLLIDQIYHLTQLRHGIVHPKWAPASLELQSVDRITMEGITENRQVIFEDEKVCCKALFYCLLVIARVGQISGAQSTERFMFHWTGIYDLTLDVISKKIDATRTME